MKNSNIVSINEFASRFMANQDEPFVYTQNPIQIYPLSIATSFIKAPVPLFRTQYNFLLVFTNGGGKQQVDNEILDLQANDILFIREGHLNAIKSIDSATDGYYLYVENVLLPIIFEDKTLLNRFTFNPKHTVSKEEMRWLCKCCDLMIEQKNDLTSSKDVMVSLLKALVLKLAKTWPAASSKPDRPSEITMLFKELLYLNFTQKREVKFYADALSVSENYLNRCVNLVTNKAPKLHINELVIYHSKVLLQDLSKDISEVAYELHFSDPSYFGRLFKQLTQMTPSEYRNSLMQDLSE